MNEKVFLEKNMLHLLVSFWGLNKLETISFVTEVVEFPPLFFLVQNQSFWIMFKKDPIAGFSGSQAKTKQFWFLKVQFKCSMAKSIERSLNYVFVLCSRLQKHLFTGSHQCLACHSYPDLNLFELLEENNLLRFTSFLFEIYSPAFSFFRFLYCSVFFRSGQSATENEQLSVSLYYWHC